VSTTTIRRARAPHPCLTGENYVACRGEIRAGEMYQHTVLFPGEMHMEGATSPAVYTECRACADYYSRWDARDLYGRDPNTRYLEG
jgi:hypothetical protein